MEFEQLSDLATRQEFDTLVERLYAYYPRVRALVLKYGGSEDDAKDTFQEGLVLFIDKLKSPDFKLTCKPETFLYSVCHNVWRITKRGEDKKIRMDRMEVADMDDDDISIHLQKEEQFNQLDTILGQIGDKCKKVLQMYYFKKFSMKEIAQKMGFSSEQVAKNSKYKCMEHAKRLAAEMSVPDEQEETYQL